MNLTKFLHLCCCISATNGGSQLGKFQHCPSSLVKFHIMNPVPTRKIKGSNKLARLAEFYSKHISIIYCYFIILNEQSCPLMVNGIMLAANKSGCLILENIQSGLHD